jgi:positive phototaxis protein PixI
MFAASLKATSESLNQVNLGKPYIQFRLDSSSVGLITTEHAREVVDVPVHRLTPIPNMPGSILGLMNWRSLAIWAIDLPQLMGSPRLSLAMQQYHMMIIRTAETPLALAVPEIEGVARLRAEQIVSPVGMTPVGIVPFLQGCVVQDHQIWLVLDALAIAQSLQPGSR